MSAIEYQPKSLGKTILPESGRVWSGQLRVLEYYSAKDAVASIIKRLANRNANVQLYTLEVRSGTSLEEGSHC